MNTFSFDRGDRIDFTCPSEGVPHRDRRPLRMLLIGTRADVSETIQNLHKRGFAEVGEWSVPIPYPRNETIDRFVVLGLENAVISIHTKYLS